MTSSLLLERKLLSELGKHLSQRGFAEKAVGQSFRMKKPFGWASLHFGFIRHQTGSLDVTVNVALRIDGVQVALDAPSPLIKTADRKNAATIGLEVGNLLGVGQKRWEISKEAEVVPVSIELMNECETHAIPFIEKYSDLGVLLSALKSDHRFAQLVLPIPARRIQVIEALSSLVGN